MMNFSGFRRVLMCGGIVTLAGAMLGLSGCALGTFETSPGAPVIDSPTAGAAMKGKVFGGQQAISGTKIYLYAAGNSAAAHTYGTGATSLLTSAVLTNNTVATDTTGYTGIGGLDGNNNYYVATDTNGAFSLASDYSCPGAVNGYPAEVYLLAVGGNSGGGTNNDIALMAALGPCTSASALAASLPFISLNEITTVAAVWALQQFMSAPTGVAGSITIGAPSTNLVGLQNAFTMAANLANVANGSPYTTNTVATAETDHIFTVADILSYCVNANNASSNCSNLFASVTPAGTALSTKGVAASTLNAPADTVQAAWYLAQFPTNIGATTCGSAGAAFNCISSSPPWTAMSTSPTDWTLAVGYKPLSGGTPALDDPYYIVLDGYGNAWIDSIGSTSQSVVPLAPNGTPIYAPVTSYVVGANSGYAANLVTTYGITSAASPFTRTIVGPRSMAVDSLGNVWLADYNSDVAATGEVAISGGTFVCPTTTGETCDFGTVAEFPAATGIGVASNSGVAGYFTPSFAWGAAADAAGNAYFSFAGGSTTYGSKVTGKISSSGVFTSGEGLGTHAFGLIVDNNTAATNGPLVWTNVMTGCVPTSGGEASLIFQSGSQALATTTTYSGLLGSNNSNCTSSVRDRMTSTAGLAVGVLFDSSNNIWLINSATEPLNGSAGDSGYENTVTYGVVSLSSGKALVSTTDSNASLMSSAGLGGMTNPQYGEVDGAGNLWIANYGAPAISEVNVVNVDTSSMAFNSLSGTSGFQHSETGSALTDSEGLGIDLSGNVWVTNTAGTSIHYVTVLIGAATPVGPMIPGKYGVAP